MKKILLFILLFTGISFAQWNPLQRAALVDSLARRADTTVTKALTDSITFHKERLNDNEAQIVSTKSRVVSDSTRLELLASRYVADSTETKTALDAIVAGTNETANDYRGIGFLIKNPQEYELFPISIGENYVIDSVRVYIDGATEGVDSIRFIIDQDTYARVSSPTIYWVMQEWCSTFGETGYDTYEMSDLNTANLFKGKELFLYINNVVGTVDLLRITIFATRVDSF